MSESFRLSGDPSSIRASARQWQTFADAASSASGDIKTLDTAEFVGDEAETYKEQINSDLPTHLNTASQAWGIVARALSTYAGELEGYQTTMSSLATRAGNQQQSVDHQQSQVSNAKAADAAHAQAITLAKSELKPGQTLPPDTYHSTTSSAQSNLDSARGALQATYDAASKTRSDNADAVQRCRREIDRAKDLRFAKPPGFWGRLKNSVCDWIADHADVLMQISSVLKTISGIAGLIAMIPIPGLQELALGVALAAGGAALLIDVGVKLATGKGSWVQIGIEALSLIPGAKAAMFAGAASTAYTGYEVSQGKASVSDLIMSAGMTALSVKGGMRDGMPGERGMPNESEVKLTSGPHHESLPPTKATEPEPKREVYEPTRRRVTLRKQTKLDVYADARRAPNGEDFVCSASGATIPAARDANGVAVRVDPETGRPDPSGMTVPEKGTFHFGHKPDHEWRTYKQTAEQNNYDRARVIEDQNDPDIYRLETPQANQSHVYEAKPVG